MWSDSTKDALHVCNEKCAWSVTDSQVDCREFTATMLFRRYDNSYVESIQLQNYSLWYLLPTKIKTEDTGQFKSTLSDSRLLFSDLRLTGDRFLWGSWFALDCKRYKNTSCFSTAYIQQEGCCQLNMCVAGSASTLTCYQTNFHQPTNEADFNNNFFAKSLIIVFQ